MVVRIVKDWDYPETFFGQTPNGNGVWGDITFTEDRLTECDYLIVLQRPPYPIHINCPEGNVWLIVQEPPVDYFRFLIKSFKYFDRVFSYYTGISHPDIGSIQPVLPWHVLKSYRELSAITIDQLDDKSDEVVWITSNKRGFPGQTSRMEFRDFLQESNFHFHLYGRGFTPIQDKFDGLFPFKYALAIENYCADHYWTEKIADSFLSWCLPFYWGAGNLEDYFPADSFIRIDVNDPPKALMIIRNALNNKEWEKRLGSIEKARNLILNKYQFFPYVSKMILDDKHKKKNTARKNYLIPLNKFPWSYKVLNKMKYYISRVFLRN